MHKDRWIFADEPSLIAKLYNYITKNKEDISYDSSVNKKRLDVIEDYYKNNSQNLYNSCNNIEKKVIKILYDNYGWIVIDNIENTLKIVSKLYFIDYESLKSAIDSLFSKFILFKFDRLSRDSFILLPQKLLELFRPYIEKDFNVNESRNQNKEIEIEKLSIIHLIASLFSYIVTYSPRSSDNNQIHKIDLDKLTDFFKDYKDQAFIENVVVKLSKFGFFQKFNNRIIINKKLFDNILKLNINEQLFIVFLYDFVYKFELKPNILMTIKNLSIYNNRYNSPMPLRELFFSYLNNTNFTNIKNNSKNIKQTIKEEEIKFLFLIKDLKKSNLVDIYKKENSNSVKEIDISTDSIMFKEIPLLLLTNYDFSKYFKTEDFIVESNYEVMIEPTLKPEILFFLSLITEPVTVQTISIFKITRESLFKSYAYGIKPEEIINFLSKHSRHGLPDNVREFIEDFYKNIEISSNNKKITIFQISAHNSNYFRELYKNKIIEIEPHIFLIFDENIKNEIEEYCKANNITCKKIKDYINNKYYSSMIGDFLDSNIKHLHTIKEFFEFYGNNFLGNFLKIDNTY